MNNIRYTHLRHKETTLTPEGVKESLQSKGGATIAWFYDDENAKIVYAVSPCSMKDNFNRRIGRGISKTRLTSKPNKYVHAVAYSKVAGENKAPSYKQVNQYFAGVVAMPK